MRKNQDLKSMELLLIKDSLRLTASEIATNVCGFSKRSWLYWERGVREVPAPVLKEVMRIYQEINSFVDFIVEMSGNVKLEIPYYYEQSSFVEAFNNENPVSWKLWQYMATTLYYRGINIQIKENAILPKSSLIKTRFDDIFNDSSFSPEAIRENSERKK